VAEWARIVYHEISASTPPSDTGLAYTWRRVGGIAGFCDILKVFRSGLVVTASCKGPSETITGSRWLTAEQLDQLYGWVDGLKSTDGIQADNAVADSMKITWALTATGGRATGELDRQALLAFGGQVFATRP
jgi:hypothetical protein